LELRLTPFGHLGVFPEQAENWDWIREQVGGTDVNVLNLFAYTGGSTLAAAAAGARVTHVDSARNVVQWARRNAERSGLEAAPIRWIAEDACRFVQRELHRGRRYNAVILDPPSYGHGVRGEAWHIDRHLLPLLTDCSQLICGQATFGIITCHTPHWGVNELRATILRAGLCSKPSDVYTETLWLCSTDGRRMSSGVVARWSAERD
jgi:23S rRNA (cytosine1962-C5)-methyltransferase